MRRRPEMSRGEAAKLLGVDPGAGPAEVRAAFRAAVRRHHPDTTPGDGASERTARILEAYHVMRARAPLAPPRPSRPTSAPTPRPRPAGRAGAVGPSPEVGAVVVEATSASGLFDAVLEAAHQLGVVTYASRSDGIVESLLELGAGRHASLLLRLDPMHASVTVTTDALDAGPAPDPVVPARDLARLLGG